MATHSEEVYQRKKSLIVEQMKLAVGTVALRKSTSNLFCNRSQGQVGRIDVRSMNQVIAIDTKRKILDVEGMATYEDIVDATLQQGLMPPVVPQLKTITIGGGVSGLAIESSSWREGLTHESVLEAEVLLADGSIARCSPTSGKDLFYALPNSYGTLGYILRLKVPLRSVRPYVKLLYARFDSAKQLVEAMTKACNTGKVAGKKVDFIDGVAFAEDELYLCTGTFVDEAPYTSDYTFEHMYFQSIRERSEDYLTTHDYIWRWDTDWFWCSKNVGAQHWLLRRLLGRKRLGSKTYASLMRFEAKYRYLEKFLKVIGRIEQREEVIQDVQLPASQAADFLSFFHASIGIKPIWICPTRAIDNGGKWPWLLYPMDPGEFYLNIGFWDSVPSSGHPSGYHNRLIEKQLMKQGGTKSLYSSSFYTKAEFARLYNGKAYEKIEAKYDPKGRCKTLYQKAVKRS